MNKTTISIVVTVIVLVGLIALGRPATPSTSPQTANSANSLSVGQGTLTVEASNFYDFGNISMAAGKVQYAFTVKNTGSAAVTIGKIYTSCMCTSASIALNGKQFGPFGMPGHGAIPPIRQTLEPGSGATVEVVFDPAAHGPAGVGKIHRTVTIEQSAGQPVQLSFTALVTP